MYNVCKLVNKIGMMMDYSLFGETKPPYMTEISLPEAIVIILLGILWVVSISWWMIPIQFVITKLHLRDITFKCNK